jgi:hypothetical protein
MKNEKQKQKQKARAKAKDSLKNKKESYAKKQK